MHVVVSKELLHTLGWENSFMKNKVVISPCVKICKMNVESGFCEGCFRTLDEIAAWGSLDNGRKLQIYKQLERRKQNAARKAS